jgi:hypothetical protein
MGQLSHERIAPPGYSHDVSGATFAVTQRLAERGNLHAEGAFIDRDIGPDMLEQFLFADDPVRALDEDDKDFERTTPEMNRRPITLQLPMFRLKSERAKPDGPRRGPAA